MQLIRLKFGRNIENTEIFSLFFRDPWIVKSTDVEIDEEKSLGKGAFSEVFLGVLNGFNF